jgi:hypothetical protein
MSQTKLAHRCGVRCITESRFPPPAPSARAGGIQPEIVVDVHRGKVPLWAPSTILNWRFDERSLERYEDPEAMKRKVRRLLREAVDAWEDAAPVTFTESHKGWDFEIAIRKRKDCDESGCTLASAFFPDSVRQRVLLFPTLFDESRTEQHLTMVHELGHIFGLRHFFADTDADEKKFPSLIFGQHSRFTIMNYGSESRLTQADRKDLKRLYKAAWSAEPEAEIGKQVRLVKAPHVAL